MFCIGDWLCNIDRVITVCPERAKFINQSILPTETTLRRKQKIQHVFGTVDVLKSMKLRRNLDTTSTAVAPTMKDGCPSSVSNIVKRCWFLKLLWPGWPGSAQLWLGNSSIGRARGARCSNFVFALSSSQSLWAYLGRIRSRFSD